MEAEKMLKYLVGIILVLVIIVLLYQKLWKNSPCVKFRKDDSVMLFNKNDPPAACKRVVQHNNDKLNWMRISMPSSYRSFSVLELPDYDVTEAVNARPLPPDIYEEIAGMVPLKHKPFDFGPSPSHMVMDSFNP